MQVGRLGNNFLLQTCYALMCFSAQKKKIQRYFKDEGEKKGNKDTKSTLLIQDLREAKPDSSRTYI